jgi:hypothetical protein
MPRRGVEPIFMWGDENCSTELTNPSGYLKAL